MRRALVLVAIVALSAQARPAADVKPPGGHFLLSAGATLKALQVEVAAGFTFARPALWFSMGMGFRLALFAAPLHYRAPLTADLSLRFDLSAEVQLRAEGGGSVALAYDGNGPYAQPLGHAAALVLFRTSEMRHLVFFGVQFFFGDWSAQALHLGVAW